MTSPVSLTKYIFLIFCGSAGTYNLLQSDIADRLLKNKISNIDKTKPQIITTVNINAKFVFQFNKVVSIT